MKPSPTFALAVTAAIAALLACTPPAFAQPGQDASLMAPAQPPPGAGYGPPAGAGRGFGRPMTLAQYQARFRDRIMQADTDRDGRVSLAEWMAYHAQTSANGGDRRGGGSYGDPARQFQMMDTNHDGYVTPAEINAASAERFARMDANHDGVLTPDERRAMRGSGMGGGEAAQPPQ